jgi:post-segregation antitoxin (ccd killing protein)
MTDGAACIGVYTMRMARINVYLPDNLARQARAAGMSVSNLTQAALRRELAARGSAEWLKRLGRLHACKVTHEQVLSALDAAREEFGRRRG